jgi:hypothetical protein
MMALLAHGNGGAPLPSAVVFDPKGDPQEWASWGPAHGYAVSNQVEDIKRFPKVVYLVDQLALDDRAGWKKQGSDGYTWTDALIAAYNRGNTTVVFEEGHGTIPVNANPWARKVITQGRSLGLSTWTAVQRSSWVDPFVIRMAEHVFCFALFDDGDLAVMRERRGIPCDLLAQLGPREFGYHRLGSREWIRCPPIDI